MKKELSIFVDESGMFGDFNAPTKNYQITFVFHDQSEDVKTHINSLERCLELRGISKDIYIHSGPLINNKDEFKGMSVIERKHLFSSLFLCFKHSPLKVKTFRIERKYVDNLDKVHFGFISQINDFLLSNKSLFRKYDVIKIYYDRGRREVSKILHEVFNKNFANAVFKKNVSPNEHRLLQIADMVCELDLIEYKIETQTLTKSEKRFFGGCKDIRNQYLKSLKKKRFK